MSWFIGRDAVDGYVYLESPAVEHVGGPSRVVTDEPAPNFKKRPVGFTATRSSGPCPRYDGEQVDAGPRCCDLSCRMSGEVEPILWEGDDS